MRRKRREPLRRNNIRLYGPSVKRRPSASRRQKKTTLKPSKLAKELVDSVRPSYWRKHKNLFWFLFAASVFLAGYIFVFYSRFFLVDEIAVIRHDLTIDRSAVEENIGYIYGENIFTIDTERLQKKLSDKFPALAYATIKKVYPRTIEIEVDSFDDAVVVKDPLGVSYGVNEIGMVTKVGIQEFNLPIIKFVDRERMRLYEEKQNEGMEEELALPDGETPEDELEVAVLVEEEATEESLVEEAALEGVLGDEVVPEEESEEVETIYEVGEIIVTQEQLNSLLEAKEKFERKFNLMVDSVEYYPVEREFYFIVAAAYPYAVKIDLISPMEEQFEKLKDVSQKIDLKNEPLEYIDLRVVGNKVFYKPLEVD